MNTLTITAPDGSQLLQTSVRADIPTDEITIAVLKAIRDIPAPKAPRKTRIDAGKSKTITT